MDQLLRDQPFLMHWAITMLVLIVAITFHEFGHAIAADRLGDNTPRSQGRLTINPIDHLDPLGTLMMAVSTYTGFGIGWGRPVLVQFSSLRHPRRDMMLVALAGPATNVIQALIFAVAVRLNDAQGWVPAGSAGDELLTTGVWINLALIFFNLIPITPLDGSKVLSALLPLRQAQAYDRFMGTFGLILFLGLALTRASSYIIGPPVLFCYRLLVGF